MESGYHVFLCVFRFVVVLKQPPLLLSELGFEPLVFIAISFVLHVSICTFYILITLSRLLLNIFPLSPLTPLSALSIYLRLSCCYPYNSSAFHLFNRYLLNAYYMLGTDQGLGGTRANMADRISALMESSF